jgi:hypothetical protein
VAIWPCFPVSRTNRQETPASLSHAGQTDQIAQVKRFLVRVNQLFTRIALMPAALPRRLFNSVDRIDEEANRETTWAGKPNGFHHNTTTKRKNNTT